MLVFILKLFLITLLIWDTHVCIQCTVAMVTVVTDECNCSKMHLI